MRTLILAALLLLPSPAFAAGWTPAIVQWYRDWKNPPPAPRAEHKYCQEVKNLRSEPDMAVKMERNCPRAGVYAEAYLAADAKIKGDTSTTSCTHHARHLQLLQDEIPRQAESCDTKAKAAAADKGRELAKKENKGQARDIAEAAEMQEAQVPVREACVAELRKLDTAAAELAKATKAQAEEAWAKVRAAQKAQNGWASGGLPCKQQRSRFENRVRTIYATLTKLASEAEAAAKKAEAGIRMHETELAAIRGHRERVDGVSGRLR